LQQNIDSLLKPHEKNGEITVVFRSYTEDWNGETAGHNLKKAINFSGIKPDAIIAGYDGMSEAAIAVMKELYGEVGDVVITGQDAELRALKHIVEGDQTMTAFHSPKDNAYACVDAIVALMNGKKASSKNITYTFNGAMEVPTIKIPSQLVTKENLEQVIIKNKAFTYNEIYN
jgi:ABC-type xylose transport system, periplasmic component